MLKFICNYCNKSFNRKSHLNYHLNRKKSCINDNDKNYDENESEKNEIIINNDQDNESNIENTENELEIELEDKKYRCKYCYKSFTRQDNLNRHIEITCIVKKKVIEEREQIFRQLIVKEVHENELQQQIKDLIDHNKLLLQQYNKKDEELSKKNNEIYKLIEENTKKNDEIYKLCLNKNSKSKNIINNLNNTNSNNIVNNNCGNINIQIVQFGKEDFKQIDDKYFQNIIKNPRIVGLKVPEEILKLIHYNPDYPQFHNFFISDFNRDKIMVHDGETWILETPDKIKNVLEQIILYSKDKIEQYNDKKNNNDVLHRLKRIQDAINKCDDDFIDELKEMCDETENNKHIINKIKDCEEFQKITLQKIKKTAYNQGKKIIKK